MFLKCNYTDKLKENNYIIISLQENHHHQKKKGAVKKGSDLSKKKSYRIPLYLFSK